MLINAWGNDVHSCTLMLNSPLKNQLLGTKKIFSGITDASAALQETSPGGTRRTCSEQGVICIPRGALVPGEGERDKRVYRALMRQVGGGNRCRVFASHLRRTTWHRPCGQTHAYARVHVFVCRHASRQTRALHNHTQTQTHNLSKGRFFLKGGGFEWAAGT